MHILLVHNRYKIRGGEDVVVEAEAELLRQHGHKVSERIVDNDAEIRTRVDTLRTAVRVHYSAAQRDILTRQIERERPDIVHVHNFFPLLSPSVFDACFETGTPSVMTLHNFRLLCAGGTLMRDGKICEECVGHTPWPALRHRCYRGSLLGTLALVRMTERAKRHATWERRVHRFIVLTQFARSKFVEGGLPGDSIRIKPNFLPPTPPVAVATRSGALFVGRLDDQKGIRFLLDAWSKFDSPSTLRIAGDGPLASFVTLEAKKSPHVEYLGRLTEHEVDEQMSLANCLVFPSVGYEGFPMVILKAMRAGLPIVATQLGGLPEIIDDENTGLLVAPNDAAQLENAVSRLERDEPLHARLSHKAQQTFLAQYSADQNHEQLVTIYEEAIRDHQGR